MSRALQEFFARGVRLLGAAAAVARCALLGVLVAVACSVEAQDARGYSEAEVKAAFLYHFGTYVQWPAAPRDTGPITIAVLGAGAVVEQLRAFLPGRTIDGRTVEVRPLARIEELGDDEILFIGGDRNGQLTQLVAAVGKRPVLVVTDAADGLSRGAMVNFQIVDQRVRFEISVPKAEDAGLTLSSRLLSAALRVQTSSSGLDLSPRLAPMLGFATARSY